jgi:pimeloyl-ACP methyl ester carboxylesterase
MTVVLVHGNPETDSIWQPLVDALGRDDVVRLSPPGFGAPLPDGFSATYLAYRGWLEDELEGFDEPVDVVGHDWGGGHVVNVMMHRPELVRSWASDAVVGDVDWGGWGRQDPAGNRSRGAPFR